MPVVKCSGCHKSLRVPDENIGKRMKCPGCDAVFMVPGVGVDTSGPSAPWPNAVGPAKETGQWYVKTPEGQEFGPVSQTELERWVAEGRVTEDSQLLREGGDQWQWLNAVFPVFAQSQAPASEGPTSALSIVTDEGSQSLRRLSFRPRKYPAMLVYRTILVVFGWIVVINGLFGVGFILMTTIRGVAVVEDDAAKFALMGTGVFFAVLCALTNAILVVFLWFLAEAIKMAMDIQDNTHRTSHYLKGLISRQ